MTARRRTARRLAALGAGVAVLTCAAMPAVADNANGIRSVAVNGDQVRIVVSSTALRQQVRPGSQDVTLHVDGVAVPARVTTVSGQQTTSERRSVLLLVDTSGSMAGAGIAGAKAAANVFLNEVPSDVLVGLTTFDSGVHPLSVPTTNRATLRLAVARLITRGETSLNDGVLSAVRTLGTVGTRRIVLLSDGADSVSKATLASAVAALRASRIQLSPVQFGPDTSSNVALRQLAAISGGRPAHAADAAALATAFTTAAHAFAANVEITATLPAAAAGRNVQFSVSLGNPAVVSSTRFDVPAFSGTSAVVRQPTASAPEGWFGSRASLPWAGAAVFAGLLALLIVGLDIGGAHADAGRRTRRVLARYSLLRHKQEEAPAAPGVMGDSAVARSALELAGRVTQRRNLDQRLARKLDQAALPLRPNEWVLIQFLLTLTVGSLAFAFTSNALLAALLAPVLGVAGPWLFLRRKVSRRQRAFLEILPDSLQLIAGGLSSGYSLPQALDTVVREGAEPIAGELGQALAAARIGVPLEDALDAIGERLECEDFRWVVMAIRVQREVGGNLAGVLSTVATTLRERARIRRQVRTLSAEGRLSAWILIGLPILLALYQLAFRGEYFKPMYTTAVGIAMLSGTAFSLVIGALWMNKLVKVEV
jgi:Flp pilus assembly protein TadB/Mg-chelatase subunit ChlD